MVRKVIVGVVAASAVAAGLFAGGNLVASQDGPGVQSVQAGQIAYSPNVNNKQNKHQQPPQQTPPGAPHPGHW